MVLGLGVFPTEMGALGEAGLRSLVMGDIGSVLLPGFVVFPPGTAGPLALAVMVDLGGAVLVRFKCGLRSVIPTA